MLYIVPTPVGNLEDITLRAIKVLKEVDLILAEDTRTSGILLKHYDIHTPMISHHKFNEHSSVSKVMDRLKAGDNIALVSDAGTPGISDPGFMLSRECRREGIKVECLPGATAFVPALLDSGLPCERFVFEGFLPVKKGRATRLAELASEPRTIVIYESPKRIFKTLSQLKEYFGADREGAVVREISKIHETAYRDTLENLTEYFENREVKGEVVIVVEGAPAKKKNKKDFKEKEENN